MSEFGPFEMFKKRIKIRNILELLKKDKTVANAEGGYASTEGKWLVIFNGLLQRTIKQQKEPMVSYIYTYMQWISYSMNETVCFWVVDASSLLSYQWNSVRIRHRLFLILFTHTIIRASIKWHTIVLCMLWAEGIRRSPAPNISEIPLYFLEPKFTCMCY